MQSRVVMPVVMLLLILPLSGRAGDPQSTSAQSIHINQNDLPWSTAGDSAVSGSMRWRTLLGTGGILGEGLPNEDLYVRQGEMDPGAVYPDHENPSPEAWFFISGLANWRVDGEEFMAEPGSAVYLKPNAVSSVNIVSKDRANIVRLNWGTKCNNRPITNEQYVFLGGRQSQTPRSRLPKWDYAGDTTRHPITGDSNLDTPLSPTSSVHLKTLNYHDVRWTGSSIHEQPSETYPMRWITLVGDAVGPTAGWGQGLPNSDMEFGIGEGGSTAVYAEHKHDAPEFYYVVSGRLRVKVDGHEFTAQPGELIYHKPWAIHRSEVASKSQVILLWADWGTNCDRSVLKQPYKMLAVFPKQPERENPEH